MYRRIVINPQCGECCTLYMEEGSVTHGLAPIFLALPPPHQETLQLDNSYWVHGEPLDMWPELLDTDTIDMPGVSARIFYSSILPRNEGRYFLIFELHLAIISYPIVFLIFLFSLAFSFGTLSPQGTQGGLVANAMNRERLVRQEAQIHDLTRKSFRWKEDEQVLNMKICHLESDKTGLEAQLQDLSLSRHAITEELEARNRAYKENISLLMEAQGEVSHLKAGLACAEERVAHTQLEIGRASCRERVSTIV